MTNEKRRITITLPVRLLAQLDRHVFIRRQEGEKVSRSLVISTALKDKEIEW